MERRAPVIDGSSSESGVSSLTHGYRRRLLELASAPSTSRTSVSWHAAQHVLDQLWSELKTNMPKESFVYGCQGCGSVLQPGYNGTSLRVQRNSKKASRSLRRRHQRKMKQLALNRQKQAKDQNSCKPVAHQQSLPSEKDKLVLLDHDDSDLVFDRHHLVIRCGDCKAKIRAKGLKREPQDLKLRKEDKTKSRIPQIGKRAPVTKDDSLDFVQLPPTSSKPAASSFLAQQGRHQRKKKKLPASKTKLLTFLSSLND